MSRSWFRPALAGGTAAAMLGLGAVVAMEASAATTRYEAEQQTIVRGAVERNHAGYTGTGFVNYVNEAGSYVEWALPSTAGGNPTTLTFRYANGTAADRPTSVSVNGAVVATVAFPPTGAWTTWRTVSVNVVLPGTAARVRATATGATGGPNIDSLTLVDTVMPSPSTSGTAGPDWSVAVVESTMARRNSEIMGGWNYTTSLFLYGQYLVYKRTGDRRYLDYVKSWVDRFVDSTGRLRTNLNSLDNMRGGVLLLAMYTETGDQRYRTAATQIRTRLDTYPRTTDGGFHHFTSRPNQLWADGVYMVNPFLASYGRVVGDSTYAYDEAARQMEIYYSHLARPNGLLWHGYDQTRTATWADRTTGTSPESWCRAIGWFAMASIDILEVLPADHARRGALVTMVQNLARAFVRYQDPVTGRWFQVVDRAASPDNWTETSCSSMYTFMLSRGVQRGYLDASYRAAAQKGYAGVLAKISHDAGTGGPSLTDIVVGTEIGDYQYYIDRPRRTNDLHGLGAFLIMNEQLRTP